VEPPASPLTVPVRDRTRPTVQNARRNHGHFLIIAFLPASPRLARASTLQILLYAIDAVGQSIDQKGNEFIASLGGKADLNCPRDLGFALSRLLDAYDADIASDRKRVMRPLVTELPFVMIYVFDAIFYLAAARQS
jgi:hypothetical protein